MIDFETPHDERASLLPFCRGERLSRIALGLSAARERRRDDEPF
jgi:hypothetical protein